MKPFIEELSRVDVNISSPDGTIQATMSRDSAITFKFEEPIADLHTESSLETQLENVINRVLPEYEQQVKELQAERYGESYMEQPPTGRKKRFIDLCEGIRFTAKASEAPMTIDWHGSSDIVVMVKEGSLDKLAHEEFTKRANDIVRAAFDVYGMAVKSAHRTAYMK